MTRSDRTWSDDPATTASLEPGAAVVGAVSDVPPELPGRYEQGEAPEILGAGGLGTVFGVRDRVFGREVALKLLHRSVVSGDGSHGLERRFLREGRITARLEHPAIVPVHDIGRRADGTPFYVMKRVRGRTLQTALAECRTLSDRLALLPHAVQVLHAVSYAHSRGIVHRDLKPANVMVGEFGETVVLDWGLARAVGEAEFLGPEIEARGEQTAMGTVLGTPAYMSPEQAEGRIDALDARSDVWSLGVMLFELVSGTRPFQGEAKEVLAAVRHGVAPRLRDVCPEAPHDLAAVVERALSAERADRYPSARELAADVEAFQAGRRVTAYRYGSLELLRRLLAYYRSPVAVALVVGLVALTLGAWSWSRMSVENRALERALEGALRDRALTAWDDDDPIGAGLSAAGALALVESADARGVALGAGRRWAPQLERSWAIEDGCVAIAWLGETVACAGRSRARSWTSTGEARLDAGTTGSPTALAIGHDGSIAVATDHAVARWDARGRPQLDVQLPATTLAILADGALVADVDPGLVRWSAAGDETGRLEWTGAISELSRGFAGTLVFTSGDTRGRVDPDTFSLVGTEPALPPVTTLEALGGRLRIEARADGAVRFAAGGRPLARLPESASSGSAVAVSPDGTRLAVGGADGTLRIWRLDAAGASLGEGLYGGDLGPGPLAFSPDGRAVAARTRDGALHLYEAATGAPLAQTPSRGVILGFTPDGARLLVLERSGVDAYDGALRQIGTHGKAPVLDAGVLDDDRLLLLGDAGVAVVWGLDDDAKRSQWDGTWRSLLTEPLAPRAVLHKAGTDRLTSVDLETLLEVDLAAPSESPVLDLSADGTRLAVAGRGSVIVTDVASGHRVADLRFGRDADALALSPDGSLLAAADDALVRLVEVDSWRTRATLRGHRAPVVSLAVSPDGRTLLTVDSGGSVRAWDLGLLDVPGPALADRFGDGSGHHLRSGRLVPVR